ncbi:MAG: hypothetical protein QXO76_04605 [Thermoproteota archaeon]
MRYTVQSGTYGLNIQTYASLLENVVEGFERGKPALLSVKIIKDDGRVHNYYCHYGGDRGNSTSPSQNGSRRRARNCVCSSRL